MTTFYPTEEEFALGPIPYIESITSRASETGIALIVPPPSWNPPPLAVRSGVDGIREDSFTFGVRIQPTSKLCRRRPDGGAEFGFERGSKRYTLGEFEARCREFNVKNFDGKVDPTVREVERAFWRIVDEGERGEGGCVCAEYGSDLDNIENGSGFPMPDGMRRVLFEKKCVQSRMGNDTGRLEDSRLLAWADEYRGHPWNVNNWSLHPRSMLAYLVDDGDDGDIGGVEGVELVSGVMVPWMYVGQRELDRSTSSSGRRLDVFGREYCRNFERYGRSPRWTENVFPVHPSLVSADCLLRRLFPTGMLDQRLRLSIGISRTMRYIASIICMRGRPRSGTACHRINRICLRRRCVIHFQSCSRQRRIC